MATSSLLHPDTLSALQAELAAALADLDSTGPSGLDDAQRIDAIRALEQLICTATAAQAALSAELADSHGDDTRGLAHQAAYARRESPHRAQRHLALARIVRAELPHTWKAWQQGRITEWKVTLVARETACLTLADRRAVDAAVASDADRLEAMGVRQLQHAAAAEAARIDPASAVTRRRQAEGDRHVTLRPAPDAMVLLTAVLPVKDGVGLYASLQRRADEARAAGDPRTRGQIMCDELVGRTHSPVSLGLVMSDSALFAGADDTAHLDAYGPIPAELAREIVCGALTAAEQVDVRRLYTRPDTGELVAMDSRSRRFRGSLARFVKLRDRVCRTPWCDAPVRHLDHVTDHDLGGPTSAANAQGLCEACNYAKQAVGWRARPGPAGDVETSLPTGHRYSTRPPAVATVRRTSLRIDHVLSG
jgi:hypothetical protein